MQNEEKVETALLTDLYELTMLQAYWREGMEQEAVFSLYFRELPTERNFILACGLESVLNYLEDLKFSGESLDYLSTLDKFSDEFLKWLGKFRFTGDVFAMPEGTPFFPKEPVLEVVAPLPQAQLVESFVMNQVHFQSVLAAKAARVVEAARDRTVVDFGLRRMHGIDSAVKAARAFYLAGVDATSNVLAGRVYGIPVTGTMAHSYIQAHDSELDAFRAFADLYPETVLLVDTYDTLEGVKTVISLAGEMGDEFTVRAIRLDSGDLDKLAFKSRTLLDEAGLEEVEIFASGGLDEYSIREMVRSDVPVTGFGVGTRMGVSEDSPALDMAYKLTSYAGEGRLKLSSGKKILPGQKQVFRLEENGQVVKDVIARVSEDQPGRPLLRKVFEKGRRTNEGTSSLGDSRELARNEIEKLPAGIRSIDPASPPFKVEISRENKRYQKQTIERIRRIQEKNEHHGPDKSVTRS